jgi:hypothetical protein
MQSPKSNLDRSGPTQALNETRTLLCLAELAAPSPWRPQDCGSPPKTRNSWLHRQALAIRAAHATASSREGSSNTVKPPSSVGAHG